MGVIAEQSTMLFGDVGTLMRLLVLALGAAMLFGNGFALVRPRSETPDGELVRAPMVRTATMAGVGLIATIWALASLLS